MTKIPTKVIEKLEDGLHTGTIESVEYRHEPYEYTDFRIKVNGSDMELKCGVPTNICVDEKGLPTSTLAKLLDRLGLLDKKKGAENDPDSAIGKQVKFQTNTEKTDNGEFSRILVDTIKLNEESV